MNVNDIASTVFAGGMLGMLGQGIRIAIGLKKLNDQNAANQAKNLPLEPFDPSRLILSLFTGFVAGALALLMKAVADNSVASLSSDSLITIIAVGYSGADFIEGFFNMYAKKFVPPQP